MQHGTVLPFFGAGSALASQGAWARCCLCNYSLPWKTYWQAKGGDVPLFRTSPLLVFSFSLQALPHCDKVYPCPQLSAGLKLSVFSHSGSLSLLTPPRSLISSLPSHSCVAHKEVAVKFKQQRLGCLLVSAVLELKSPGWAYWVKTHRQCTSTTNCDAIFCIRFFAFPSICQLPPTSAIPSFFLSTFCVLRWPSLPSLSSLLLPLLCFIKCNTSASLTDRGCSSLGRGDGGGGRRRRKSCSQQRRQRNTERRFLPEVNPSRPLLGQQTKMQFLSVQWEDLDCSLYSCSVFSENGAQMYSSGSPQPGLNQQNGWLATPTLPRTVWLSDSATKTHFTAHS